MCKKCTCRTEGLQGPNEIKASRYEMPYKFASVLHDIVLP